MKLIENFVSIFRPKKKVGLSLAGGAARGVAHIGVLKVLAKNNIPINFISGTSSGALIGALYAAGMHPDLMEKIAQKLGWPHFFKINFTRHGPSSTEEIKNFVIKNIGDIKFSDLKIPFAVVATEIKTGKEVVLREGKVADAVAISCSVPGVFAPVKYNGEMLVDGGIVDNLPSKIVKDMGADFVIGVDVIPGGDLKEDPKNAFQIIGKAYDILVKKNSQASRDLCDLVIEPEIPENIWHIDVHKSKKLIESGESACESRILEIKTRLFL